MEVTANRHALGFYEKAGFVYERDGTWADLPHVFYRLTADRWRALQSAHMEATR